MALEERRDALSETPLEVGFGFTLTVGHLTNRAFRHPEERDERVKELIQICRQCTYRQVIGEIVKWGLEDPLQKEFCLVLIARLCFAD